MIAARTVRRIGTGAGVLIALTASALVGAVPAVAQPPPGQHSVTVDVLDMSPTTPANTDKPRPLTIKLRLTNSTDTSLSNVSVDVARDEPVGQEHQLEQLIKSPAQSADPGVLSPLPGRQVGDLGARASTTFDYRTTTSTVQDKTGICLCLDSGGGIYPINFTVSAASEPGGATTQVGFGQTYLTSFKDAPRPMQVSWVWPLIDRPHRLLGSDVFVDDDLAASVRDGRLARALTVVEDVAAAKVKLTLVIDPELIDELATMSRPYSVEVHGKRTPGTGTAAAQAWLKRLRSVIALAPSMQVSLTPYADPDLDALTASGLGWSDNVGSQALVQQTLGLPAGSDVAWPVGEVISPDALRQVLGRRNTNVVVLGDAALPGSGQDNPRPNALAPLGPQYGAPGAVAAVTDSALQGLAEPVLAQGGNPGRLPALVADLAVRAAQEPRESHYAVITAPRYVDPDPAAAAHAIIETAHTPWSTSLTLGEAARTVAPVDHGTLVEPTSDVQLPGPVMQQARDASDFVRSFSTALSPADANRLLGGMPAAIRRLESSAWRTYPQQGIDLADALGAQIATWRDGVSIVRPSSGTYTLASSDSPLPITVSNALDVDVKVRVSITTVNGVAGFRADSSHLLTIQRAASPSNPTRSTLKIQTHVQRAGTFRVDAVLLTPDGTQLTPQPGVPLSIHSTALGAIGVIITAVAGGVLVLALGIRVTRRVRAHRTRSADPGVAAAVATGAGL